MTDKPTETAEEIFTRMHIRLTALEDAVEGIRKYANGEAEVMDAERALVRIDQICSAVMPR